MTTPDGFEIIREIVDASGNQLTLRFIEVPKPEPKQFKYPGVRYPDADDRKGYDFHSLVWDLHGGSTWQRKATITRADLEQDGTRRWVIELHSLGARNGTAILKIGEGDWQAIYSWREWDLCRNKEIRTIKVCECPFDPLDDSDDLKSPAT